METLSPERRAHDLVEEIRADIDFELDDAITEIVRNLPDEYFAIIDHKNQITHIKAMVASRICSIEGEMFVPCDSENQIAVIGRQNYRGQLAKILDQLPTGRTIDRADVYTSNSYDFIIDIFDLDPGADTGSSCEVSHTTNNPGLSATLADDVGCTLEKAERFINSFAAFRTGEQTAMRLPQLFEAYSQLGDQNTVVHWWPKAASECDAPRFTIATRCEDEKLIFQAATKLLTEHDIDIVRAKMGVLNRFPADSPEPQTILLSFRIGLRDGDDLTKLDALGEQLDASIKPHLDGTRWTFLFSNMTTAGFAYICKSPTTRSEIETNLSPTALI